MSLESTTLSIGSRSENMVEKQTGMGPMTFESRQREYFQAVLLRKWHCSRRGHVACVITEYGKHYQVSQNHLEEWVDALCLGELNTSQPPCGIFIVDDGESHKAMSRVSISRSHRRTVRTVASTGLNASHDRRLEHSSLSSGVPGPGYLAGKGLKNLGLACIDLIERIIIWCRLRKYRRYRERQEINDDEEQQLLRILDYVLEIARDCSSSRILFHVALTASGAADLISRRPESQYKLLARLCEFYVNALHASILPDHILDHIYIGLKKAPLAVQSSDAASPFIFALCDELTYGNNRNFKAYTIMAALESIITLTLSSRPLSSDEILSLRRFAEQSLEDTTRKYVSVMSVSQMEARIFTQCAIQDPWFRNIVHGIAKIMLTPTHSWFSPLEGNDGSAYMYTHSECKLWFEHKEVVNNDDTCSTLILHLLDHLRTRGIGLSLIHHKALYLTNRIITIRSDPSFILEILVHENAHILIEDVFNPSPDSLQGNRADVFDQLRPVAPNCISRHLCYWSSYAEDPAPVSIKVNRGLQKSGPWGALQGGLPRYIMMQTFYYDGFNVVEAHTPTLLPKSHLVSNFRK
ncbi:hypothetical protein BU17DRAFT_66547 [Hysterangium stoloniferum]|nr:hypothetical protein BU17DRAFT_66547 [Hysterangium stoloniferum]